MSGSGRLGRLVAVASVRSTGVTTTATAVGCAWPDPQQVLLVEADPAGGTLAAALGLAGQPGLVSLATAARRDNDPGLFAEHAQRLPCGMRVVVGPPSGEQARAALRMLTDPLTLLSGTGRVVLVDCGRLDADSPAGGVFAAAGLSLLVARPQLPDLHALAGWLDVHRDWPARLAVVLSGPGPYGAGEVADALGVDVLGGLPWDPATVAGLGQVPGRRARGTSLWRAAAALAERLARPVPVPEEPERPKGADQDVSQPGAAGIADTAADTERITGEHAEGALAGQVRHDR